MTITPILHYSSAPLLRFCLITDPLITDYFHAPPPNVLFTKGWPPPPPPRARSYNSRVTSSETCRKSSYHWPTPTNASDEITLTKSSTALLSSLMVEAGAVGTAITTRWGWRERTTSTAAPIVHPLAMPPPTTLTILPAISSGGVVPR